MKCLAPVIINIEVLICSREARRPFTYIIFNHPNFQYRSIIPILEMFKESKNMTHTNIE